MDSKHQMNYIKIKKLHFVTLAQCILHISLNPLTENKNIKYFPLKIEYVTKH